jgi:Tol biopolymer transport system component
MVDIDDGHRYLESEIYIKSIENQETIPITATPDIMELYPSWGKDNRRIVFTSVKGQIYLAELTKNE